MAPDAEAFMPSGVQPDRSARSPGSSASSSICGAASGAVLAVTSARVA